MTTNESHTSKPFGVPENASSGHGMYEFADPIPQYLCEGYALLMNGEAARAIGEWTGLFARYPSAEVSGYIARAYYCLYHFLGGRATDPACATALEAAREWSERALQLNPNSATGHTIFAITLAHRLDGKIRLINIETVIEIRRHLELAVTIDNSWAAHLMLGRWHRELTALPAYRQISVNVFLRGMEPASFETALHHFEEVLRQRPDNSIAVAEIAFTYKRMGRMRESGEMLQRCLQMPPYGHPLGAILTGQVVDDVRGEK